jgi:hypothetical protein
MATMTLTEELAELEAEAARRYDALAEAVADGLQIDAEDAQLVLKNAKRTAAELQSRVQFILRRRELAAAAATVPDLQAELNAIVGAVGDRRREVESQVRELQNGFVLHERNEMQRAFPVQQRLARAKAAAAELRELDRVGAK